MAVLVTALAVCTALGGAWAWWRAESPRWFWLLWRGTQMAATVLAGVALVGLVTGFDPDAGLFWLYMLLPIAVSLIADQLRLASAETILDQRNLENAEAVGRLPEDDQHRVVMAIIARETWIVALGCLVIAFLAARVLVTV